MISLTLGSHILARVTLVGLQSFSEMRLILETCRMCYLAYLWRWYLWHEVLALGGDFQLEGV